jgi:outer membrane protein assembly factor BamB
MDREALPLPAVNPNSGARSQSPGKERVLCLNEADGKVVWSHAYDCPYTFAYRTGPRATPLVHDGRVYTLGAMGNLLCFDAATGAVRWAKNVGKEYKTDPPAWGWSASPLLDGDLLYCLVGGEGSAVVAFNKDTGKEVWRALTTEEIGYSPPMIYEAGGKRQLIIWHSDAVNGLDPTTGKVYWTQRYPAEGEPQRPAVPIATVRRYNDLLFVTSYYHGPMMLRLAADRPAVTVVWKDKTKKPTKPIGLHCLMPSPVLKDGYIYGVCANGELRCCAMETGDQLWETYAATGVRKTDCATAFLIPQADRFILFNEHGELILANLTPKGYAEVDRAKIIEPVEFSRGRQVVWSHPAFANRCVFARNNQEIVCVSLAQTAETELATPAPPTSGPKPSNETTTELDPRATAIVKQVAELCKGVQSLHAEAVLSSTVTEGNSKRQVDLSVTYEFEKPNRFSLCSRSDKNAAAGLDVVCDGKVLYIHVRRLKEYTATKAPADLEGVGKVLPRFGHFVTGMLFPNLLAEDPDDQILDGVTACSYAGKENVAGKPGHHLRFKQGDVAWETWVAAEGEPFVLKVAMTGRTETGTFVTNETYSNWRVNSKPSNDAFRFQAPADVKQVKAFGKR